MASDPAPAPLSTSPPPPGRPAEPPPVTVRPGSASPSATPAASQPGSQPPPRPLQPARRRLALGRSQRRLSFERRLRLSLWLLALPAVVFGAALAFTAKLSPLTTAALLTLFLIAWVLAVAGLLDQIVRPLQTLANVIAALREEDYSLRARGGRRADAIGDLALEVNALAALLQGRRGSDMEATALLDRVMSAMQSPLLAFAPDGTLRLINAAAEAAFHLQAPLGQTAAALGLTHLLAADKDELISTDSPSASGSGAAHGQRRWIIQQSLFRLGGLPHRLLVLSDVSAALREEERVAWQRLIRVMGHEINNSLTPIKSIAGTLRS